jgi:recombination protein RecT
MMAMTEVGTQVNKPPIVILRERLEARAQELEAALPDDIEPRQFIRAAMTSAALNPDILATSWQSFWNACLRACRDGLLPDGVEGAVVPYKDKANWIPMYQGLLRRFRRSGQFKWVAANVVREGEKFEHYIDETGEHFKHVPNEFDLAPIVKTYACALTKDGGFFVAVLTLADIEKIKRMSRAQRDDAPWKMWPEEMMKKSALRRLVKYLPTARDVVPDEDDDDEAPDIQMPTIEHQPTAPRSAAAALDQFAVPATGPTDSLDQAPLPHGSVGEQGAGASIQAAEADSAAHEESDSTAEDARVPAAISQALLQAYETGKQAKMQGHLRKAMPGPYREYGRQREAIAWSAGYDGKPLPSFQDAS